MLYQLSYNGPNINKNKYWWIGKDSNLRTPQGRTDLQSVGFNRSPTYPTPPALPPKPIFMIAGTPSRTHNTPRRKLV